MPKKTNPKLYTEKIETSVDKAKTPFPGRSEDRRIGISESSRNQYQQTPHDNGIRGLPVRILLRTTVLYILDSKLSMFSPLLSTFNRF